METHGRAHRQSVSQQSSYSPNTPTTAQAPIRDSLSPVTSAQAHNQPDFSLNGVSIPFHLERILERYAGVLLEDYALRDIGILVYRIFALNFLGKQKCLKIKNSTFLHLGAFSSHLDFDLVQFLSKNGGAFSCPPEHFPLVLMKLHSQFKWPYPVVGDVIDRLIQKFQSAELTPSASEGKNMPSLGRNQYFGLGGGGLSNHF